MLNDEPTLTRIRNARQRISASCGHDPYKLVEHYRQYQKQYQDRLIPKDQLINPAKLDKLTEIVNGTYNATAVATTALQQFEKKYPQVKLVPRTDF